MTTRLNTKQLWLVSRWSPTGEVVASGVTCWSKVVWSLCTIESLAGASKPRIGRGCSTTKPVIGMWSTYVDGPRRCWMVLGSTCPPSACKLTSVPAAWRFQYPFQAANPSCLVGNKLKEASLKPLTCSWHSNHVEYRPGCRPTKTTYLLVRFTLLLQLMNYDETLLTKGLQRKCSEVFLLKRWKRECISIYASDGLH